MIHTPIQKLEFPNDRNVRLYCKREDLLPFSLGGNKVRIGRAFFRDMQEKNKDCMIIYGNSRSNLCRVLANLCCAEKIPCYMICSSEENEEQPIETNNSRLMKWLGAEVIPCRKTEIAQTVEQTMNRLTEEGYHPYYIFGDKFGTGNEGTPVQAYVDGYREILAWEKEQNISFSHIFAASGTGSTQCGLVSGKLLEQGTEQIIGLSISSREYDRAIRFMETAEPVLLFERTLGGQTLLLAFNLSGDSVQVPLPVGTWQAVALPGPDPGHAEDGTLRLPAYAGYCAHRSS